MREEATCGGAIDDALKRLRCEPIAARDDIPEVAGVYVWWCPRGAIPDVPKHPIHVAPVDVLCVGIAAGTSAKTSLRRKIADDLHRPIERSRFRFDLAALLETTLSLELMRSKSQTRTLSPADDARLTEWQQQNLTLTWAAVAEPKPVEVAAIAALHPPLNLPYKGWDVFWHANLAAKRATLRAK